MWSFKNLKKIDKKTLCRTVKEQMPFASFVLAAMILFVACYHSTLAWMYGRYISADSYYSHGFLVPFVTGYLIWRERGRLRDKDPGFSWLGLFVMAIALLIHVFGTIIYVFSVSGFSIFLLILGLSLFLFGGRVTRIILFPLVFTIFMFPLPSAFIGVVSFPLKLFVAKSGAWIAGLMGIPVYLEGFYITIPAGSLLVGNPCSGLRSLITFLALGSILAYFSPTSLWRRGLIIFLSVPTAIVSNVIRVPTLITISHYWGLEAAMPGGFWHDASGIMVFVIGFFLLICFTRMLEWGSTGKST
ncbi:MAG: exosortase/archaeosortase family protein [Syntrophales bacterium]|nr:exosortase/archaeosortase family protein [Syntrophales bacterium]